MDKNTTVKIEKVNGVDNVVITEEVPCEPEVKKRVMPYETIIKHIADIDESIARLQEEKLEYEALKGKADIEIAKI